MTRLRAAALTCLSALIVAGLPGCASHQLPASAKAATAGWIHGPLACPHCGSAEACHCCRPHCWNQGYHCTTWSRLEPCFDQTMYLGTPQPAYPPPPTEELPLGNPFQDDMPGGTEMPDRLEPPGGADMPGGPDMDTSRREPDTGYLLDPYLQDVSFTTPGPQYRMGRLMRLPYVEPPKLKLESELPLQPAEPPELLSEQNSYDAYWSGAAVPAGEHDMQRNSPRLRVNHLQNPAHNHEAQPANGRYRQRPQQ